MNKVLLGFSLFALSTFAGEWKGTISDAKCAAAHADASDKSMACVKGCVKKGAAPVLVSDGKIYSIANAAAVQEHLGEKVTVNGKMDGTTITVESVSAN